MITMCLEIPPLQQGISISTVCPRPAHSNLTHTHTERERERGGGGGGKRNSASPLHLFSFDACCVRCELLVRVTRSLWITGWAMMDSTYV